MADFGTGMDSSSNTGSSNRGSAHAAANFMEQLKRCIPNGADFIGAFRYGLETTSALIKDVVATLKQHAETTAAAIETQIRQRFLPLALFACAFDIINRAVIGRTLGPLGMWREPLLQSICFHFLTTILMLGCIVASTMVTRKLLNLSDSTPQLLAIFGVGMIPTWLSSPLQIVPYLGGLAQLAIGIFTLYVYFKACQLVATRNGSSTAKVLITNLLAIIVFAAAVIFVLTPLNPFPALHPSPTL